MRARFRAWLEETHGGGFELVRHFLFRIFDNEMFSVPGDWHKVAAGLFAIFLSFGIVFLLPYMKRYGIMRGAGLSAEAIHREIRSDELMFIAIAMVLTAVLTAVVWQSLFPTRRDCLALAGLPVSPRQIFLAKSGALLLMFTGFVVALTLPWALMFSGIVGDSRHAGATFAATAGVCIFVFFGLLACQGVLLTILPARLFTQASLLVQGLVFVSSLGLVPLIGRQPTDAVWWPPVWFAGLWEAMVSGSSAVGRAALLAMAIPVALSIVTYLISYKRYRRVLLEGQPVPARERWSGAGSWLLERWIPDPREQAAFSFIWKTLVRSRNHRMILLAYCGIALGAISKGMLDMPLPSLRNEGMYGLVVTLAPLATAMLITVGLRYLFSLPESLQAQWIFQITDREGRLPWFNAVGRFVVWCAIAPVFLISLPASIALFGWLRAVALTLLVFFAALVWFEIAFRKWQKLPFTCSYAAGDTPMVLTLMRYVFASLVISPIGYLILTCSGRPAAFLTLFSFEAAVWWQLRAKRGAFLATAPVVYDGSPHADFVTLDLKPSRNAEPEAITAGPVREASLFSRDALLESRSMIPQEWKDEFEAERAGRSTFLSSVLEDVRFAFRLIQRNPLFAVVVILTLTVGIGINAAVFTVVNGLALRAHVANPDTFVSLITTTRFQGTRRRVSFDEYKAWRDRTSTLRQLAAFAPIGLLMGRDEPVDLNGIAVSCNFFAVDGVDRALVGRLFVEEDCHAAGRTPVALISEGLWRKRFSSSTSFIGRVSQFNNRSVIVIGVVPAGSSLWIGARGVDIWVPYTAMNSIEPGHDALERQDAFWLSLAGRLKTGFSRSAAESEFNVIAQQTDRLHTGRRTAVIATDGSYASYLRVNASGATFMLVAFFFGTFNLVLFLACANVATLMLSRAAARRREIAVRLSLGAPRIRLIRMLVTESLVLAAAAGAISAYLTLHVPKPLFHLVAARAVDFPMQPDWRTFFYIAVVVLVTGVLAGLAPTLESLRVDLTASLKGSSNVLFGSAGGTGMRGILVSAQVALSMVLLVEAGLFVRSEDRALRADPGYAPHRVVVAWLHFPNKSTVATTRARLHGIEQRMIAVPGVRSVAFSYRPPLMRPETIELSPPERKDATQPVDVYTASPGFFETLGIPLLHGREFAESDGSSVIVSQSLAKAFWRSRNPIGQVLTLPSGSAQVVGVAKDIEPMRIGGSDNPPLYQLHSVSAIDNVMSVRFDRGAAAGVRSVREALREVEPDLVPFPMLLQSWIDRITADLWNMVALMAVLGAVGTILATTGIYGAVSFSVNQKRRDLGIRVALGATKWDIIREVFVSGGRPVVRGLVVGLWMSMATAASLHENFTDSIIRIDSGEPLLYGAAMLFLAIGAAAAMWGPARRGATADPLETLRCE